MEGFKTYEQNDIVLSAQRARRAPRDRARGRHAQGDGRGDGRGGARADPAASAPALDHPAQIRTSRSRAGTMACCLTVPGVIDTQNREAPGWNNLGGITINGGRNSTVNFSYDGVTNKDTGSNTGPFLAPGLDSIAEIKVQTSNFQAEYGRSSGGTINVVTKSGGRDFHGGGFYYASATRTTTPTSGRTTSSAAPKPPFYGSTTAAGLGGPVLLPGATSTAAATSCSSSGSRTFLPRTDPGNLERRRMPIRARAPRRLLAILRHQGRLIVIRDPQHRRHEPFPGQHHPDQPHRRERPGAAQPVPGAERHRPRAASTTTRSRRLQAAAQRPGAAHRLERRAQDHLLLAPQLRLRGAARAAAGFVLEQRQLAAAADRLRDRQLGIVNTLLHTFNPTTVDGSDRRPQPRQADRGAAHARRSAAQRPDAGGPERAAAVLPRRPTRTTSCPTPTSARPASRWPTCRSSASKAAIRSSARTTSGTAR